MYPARQRDARGRRDRAVSQPLRVPARRSAAAGESALNRLLQSQLPPEIEQSIKDAEEAIRAALQRVIEALPALDPTLGGAARTTLGRMEHDLRSLQSKVIQAAKRRDETLRRQFTRAQALIFPSGHPQERTLSVVFFLNRYGPALVDHLLRGAAARDGTALGPDDLSDSSEELLQELRRLGGSSFNTDRLLIS